MSHDSSERIAATLRRWIAAAAPGAQLPSTRTLVTEHRVSPVTVQRALRLLSSQGLTETRTGVGVFVRGAPVIRRNDYGWQTAALGAPGNPAARPATALRTVPGDAIALHAGYPDRALLPERLVRAAFGRAGRSDAAVGRPPAGGLPDLQAWFAGELGSAAATGIAAPSPRDVVIFPGSQSALGAAFRALAGPGRPLLVESPTYWGAILAARATGVRLVPVPSGIDGPDPAELARAFVVTGARAFYAQPNFSNPTGAQWSTELAERVLSIVCESGAFVIEDDWAHDFGIDTQPVPLAGRDDSGHVVYLRSLTKSVSPAVRVAGLVARGPARDRILASAEAESMYVSGVLQAVALDVVTQPAWRTHLRGLPIQLAARRDLLVDALLAHAPGTRLDSVPGGGLNLWLRLPESIELPRFVRACEDEGVIVAAGTEWFPAEPTGPYLRLNFSGPDPGAFPDAARTIGRLIDRQLGRPGPLA